MHYQPGENFLLDGSIPFLSEHLNMVCAPSCSHFWMWLMIADQTLFNSMLNQFSVCGPDVWNSLPVAVRNTDNHPAFRRALKSHLFNCFFLVTVSVHFTDFVMYSRPCFYCRTGYYNFLSYCIVSLGGLVGASFYCFFFRPADVTKFQGNTI